MSSEGRLSERSLEWRLAVAIAGLFAVLAWLSATYVFFVTLLLTPNPGQEAIVRFLQLVQVAGWLAIGLWLLRHLLVGRLRFLAGAAAAWVWMYAVGLVIAEFASLNWGY